ncbi:hypothetical protein LINPERHAP1_LOCUS17689 [Linum perenne]
MKEESSSELFVAILGTVLLLERN